MLLCMISFCGLLLADYFPSFYATPVEIVLAHCEEDTTWITQLGYDGITLSYDKCSNAEGPGMHIPQPNVGREGGTFLQHIVSRYDTLADWTVFSQAEKPTYGYRGHRLGGGHLMSNVKFQDYVVAVDTRVARPLYFIFTNILVMTDDNIYQCVREHYGEGSINAHFQDQPLGMCGLANEWKKWFVFPVWFRTMILELLQEQEAPISTFAPKDIRHLFAVDVDHGVTYFAQGARFAASREAIHKKPKAYYESLLKLMDNPDPWAGYFLEWLWWYVLGGSSGPCGFEVAILDSFQRWTQLPSRHMISMAVSGNGTDGDVLITDNTTIGGHIIAGDGRNVSFLSGSATTFAVKLTISNSGSVTGFIQVDSCMWFVNNNLTLAMTLLAETSNFNLDEAWLIFAAAGVTSSVSSTKIQCTGISSGISVTNGADAKFISTTIACSLQVTQSSTADQRTGYTTTTFCGSTLTALAVSSGSAVEFEVDCILSSGAYSNSLGTLTYSPGSLLVVTGVNRSALPTLISSWDSPAGMPVAVTTGDTGQFIVEVIRYKTSGPCPTNWTSTIFDNCPSGLTCSLVGVTYPSDTSYCQMLYIQVSSSVSGSSGSGNNDALYGLFALLAIPILGLLLLGGLWYFWRQREETYMRYQEYYPAATFNYAEAPPTPYEYFYASPYIAGQSFEYGYPASQYMLDRSAGYLTTTPVNMTGTPAAWDFAAAP